MKHNVPVIFLIKNKIIILLVLFLMKIARTLRVRGFAWYTAEKISYRNIKSLLGFASANNHFSIRLLRFTKVPSLNKGE